MDCVMFKTQFHKNLTYFLLAVFAMQQMKTSITFRDFHNEFSPKFSTSFPAILFIVHRHQQIMQTSDSSLRLLIIMMMIRFILPERNFFSSFRDAFEWVENSKMFPTLYCLFNHFREGERRKKKKVVTSIIIAAHWMHDFHEAHVAEGRPGKTTINVTSTANNHKHKEREDVVTRLSRYINHRLFFLFN